MAEGTSFFDDLKSTFVAYGLDALADVVGKIMTDHDGETDAVKLKLLYESEPYRKRFPGMEENRKRVAAGEPGAFMVSPAEYLQQEAQYRQALQSAGLPSGFYDSPDDFGKWIGGQVSPQEVQRRIQLASDMAASADPETKAALRDFYGLQDGDVVAYFLDPQRMQGTLQEAESRARAARVGAAASLAGFAVDGSWTGRAEELGRAVEEQQMTDTQLRAAYTQVADDARKSAGLNRRYGTDYDVTDAEDAALLGLASARRKRKNLSDSEQATFSGQSGVGKSSLGRASSGGM